MPVVRQAVQPGTSAPITLEVVSSPAELGKAGAFRLKEAILTVGTTRTDLVAAGWTMPWMAELAYPASGGASSAVTASPSYVAGGGSGGENVYLVTLTSTTGFLVGEHVRARAKANGGAVYRIVDVVSGTQLRLHAPQAGFDVVNGDTLEEVAPSGTYVGKLSFAVDTYLNLSKPAGEVRIIVTTLNTGSDPKFASESTLSWTFQLDLDLAGRGYVAG